LTQPLQYFYANQFEKAESTNSASLSGFAHTLADCSLTNAIRVDLFPKERNAIFIRVTNLDDAGSANHKVDVDCLIGGLWDSQNDQISVQMEITRMNLSGTVSYERMLKEHRTWKVAGDNGPQKKPKEDEKNVFELAPQEIRMYLVEFSPADFSFIY